MHAAAEYTSPDEPPTGHRSLVPVHPEPVEGDDRALRWVIPAATLDFVGSVAGTPAAMQVLFDDGTLEALTVAPTSVIIRLGAGHRWREQGPRVRAALQAALALPAEWSPAEGSRDDVLRMAVQEVIDGEVGRYIRSHGGQIELLGAHDDQVEVRLSGACTHCPASDATLSARFEVALRSRYPDLVGVTTGTDESEATRARHLLGIPRRRH